MVGLYQTIPEEGLTRAFKVRYKTTMLYKAVRACAIGLALVVIAMQLAGMFLQFF